MKNKIVLTVTLELDDESKTAEYVAKEAREALASGWVYDVVEETCVVEVVDQEVA